MLGVDAAGPPGRVVSSRVSGWRAVVRVLRSPAAMLLDDVVTTVFPADCRCCEGPLLRAGDVPVCDACVGHVERETLPQCRRCGEALDMSANSDLDMEDVRFAGMLPEGLLCRECRLAAPEFARAVAYSSYDGELRDLIRLLKFERVKGVAKLLAPKLGETILSLEGEAAQELTVIAVPLFAARVKQRGYNQSVLLADEALLWLKRERPDWKLTAAHSAMERRRSTESSFVLSRAGRRRNLRGAFKVTGDIAGREILLIDDILTSGATARECARVLMRTGAVKVWVATLARAQKGFVRRQHVDATEFVATWDLTPEGR
jgi:ComF family protein